MACFTRRKKQIAEVRDQKWEYINLADFKSKGCGTLFAYVYLWLMLFISIAVYAVDSFTAVNLLVLDKWNPKIKPAISYTLTKWIFSICIILSFVNLAYEGFRAIRVMKRGNVAESYLDSLAVRWESVRVGSGQGWRRFLVFAELTKSKKGAHYIALFTYFNLQAWIRVLICSGPRQVLNVFMLKSVYDSQLYSDSKTVEGAFMKFFENIKALYEQDYQQALILTGMCFTVVVWIFSILFLLAAVLFWLFFLWHWIPRADGGLSGYCERKVTAALLKIVTKKVNKALAKGEADRLRAEMKAAKKAGGAFEKPHMDRTATLPTLPNVAPVDEDKLPGMPTLPRHDTMATLPPYNSRPGTPGGMEMGAMDQKPPLFSRTGTQFSSASSRAALLSSASDMGVSEARRQPPSRTGTMMSSTYATQGPMNSAASDAGYYGGGQYSRQPPPQRSFTGSSQTSYGPRRPGPPSSAMALSEEDSIPAFPPPSRGPNNRPTDAVSMMNEYAALAYHPSGNDYASRDYARGPGGPPPPSQFQSFNGGRASPAPSDVSLRNPAPRPGGPGNQPVRSATGPIPAARGMPPFAPQRNMTAPPSQRGQTPDYFDQSAMRLGLAPSQRSPPPGPGPAYGYDAESQSRRDYY